MPVSLHSHFCFFCLQQYEKNIALSANLENTSHIPTSHTYCSSSSPVIYGMGAYIVMYQTHGLTPALLSLTTVGMSSQCICEKQWSVEKQPLGKHWWLFSNFGLLHQEQLAICWGQKRQLDTYILTGDLLWASPLQEQNKNSQWACVYLHFSCHPLSRQYSSVQKIKVNCVEMDQTVVAGCRFFTALLLLLCSEESNYQHTLYRKNRWRE